MFGEDHNDAIDQRGLDEAFACQDMLERTPAKRFMLTEAIARVGDAIRAIVHRDAAEKQQAIPTARRGT
jgi:hypothetical protein